MRRVRRRDSMWARWAWKVVMSKGVRLGLLCMRERVLVRAERARIASRISRSGSSGEGVKGGKSVMVGVCGGEGGRKVGGVEDTLEDIMSPLWGDCWFFASVEGGRKAYIEIIVSRAPFQPNELGPPFNWIIFERALL